MTESIFIEIGCLQQKSNQPNVRKLSLIMGRLLNENANIQFMRTKGRKCNIFKITDLVKINYQ